MTTEPENNGSWLVVPFLRLDPEKMAFNGKGG